MRIGVIGCGHVGYSHLVWLAKQGFPVKGLDINKNVKEQILSVLGQESVANSILDLSDCDSIHICVPTEPNSNGSADLTIIEDIIKEISEVFQDVSSLSVVQRSTCPPGTADKYAYILGKNISYGVNPSFLRKASIQEDTEHPERIAIGGSGLVVEHLNIIYSTIDSPRFISPNRSAVELLKYIENSIDSLLVSYWNEILEYVALMGLSSSEMIQLMEHIGDRPKFRSVIRVPGKAFGMWCLPKDINALLVSMNEYGSQANTIKGALDTNLRLAESVGYGQIPAQKLWDDKSSKVKVLPDGIAQIENYIQNQNSKSPNN